jgi:hypothetical protein
MASSGPAYAADVDAGANNKFGASEVGAFTSVEGTVSVLRAGKLPAEDAKVGSPVYEGDAVRTKRESRAEISMKDGSVLKMAESTRMDIKAYMTAEAAAKSVIGLPRGNVRAIVSKRSSEQIAANPDVNHFEIHTPNAVTGVRGTDESVGFNVPRQQTTASVHEGRVEFYNKANPLVKQILIENQISVSIGDKSPTPPRTMTEGEKKSSKESTETKKKDEDKGKDDKDKGDKGKGDDKGGDKKGEGDKDKGDKGEGDKDKGDKGKDKGDKDKGDKGEGDKGKGEGDKGGKPGSDAGKPGADATGKVAGPSGQGVVGTVLGGGMIGGGGFISSLDPAGMINAGPIPGLTPGMNINTGFVWSVGNVTGTINTGVVTVFTPPVTAIDNKPPDLIITSMPEQITRQNFADFAFSANEKVVYHYSLDAGGWVQIAGSTLEGTLGLSGLAEGPHKIDIKATDMAGNATIRFYSWMTDYTSPFLTVTGIPDIATTSKTVSFFITSNEPVTYQYTLDGATFSSPNASGLSEGFHTAEVKATDLAGNVTTKSYKWFVGDFARGYDPDGIELHYYDISHYESKMVNIGAGYTTMWSATSSNPAKFFGIESYTAMNANPHVFWGGGGGGDMTASGGAADWMHIGTEINGAFKLKFYGLYLDPSGNAGFLTGDVSGQADNMNGPGTVVLNGVGYVVPVTTLSVTPQTFANGIVKVEPWIGSGDSTLQINSSYLGGAYGRSYDYYERYSKYSNQMGVWITAATGSYSGISISDSWYSSLMHSCPHMVLGYEINGTKWSDGIITGAIMGYRATAIDPVGDGPAGTQVNKTGITVGNVMGTFDASRSMFQMVSAGIYMETNMLLSLASTASGQATLQQLGIPAFEVGRTTLKGSVTGGNGSIDLYSGTNGINNVIFLSPTSGGAPQIWASGDVKGIYTGNPVGLSVPLTGSNGITAYFTPTSWRDNSTNWSEGNFNESNFPGAHNQWLAKIVGSGTLTGGAWNGPLQIKGAAAGTLTGSKTTSGTFAGTAAGVSR